MTHNQQALLAASRGARVQYFSPYKNKWVTTGFIEVPNSSAVYKQRIHPDDEHLRFGPLSEMLLEAAKVPTLYALREALPFPLTRFSIAPEEGWHDANDMTRSIYLLLMAECLADGGL